MGKHAECKGNNRRKTIVRRTRILKLFLPILENQDMNYYVKQTNQTKKEQTKNQRQQNIKTALKFKEKLENPSDLCNASNIVQGKWNISTFINKCGCSIFLTP